MKHIAVVCRLDTDISLGTNGAWSAFIGEDQDEVITKALKHKEVTSNKYGDRGFSYTVLVGELTLEALPRAEYNLRSIKGGK